MYPYNNQMYQQELQNMRDRIDRQLQQAQGMQNQQPTAINQTFQLSPNQNQYGIKYVNSTDDVKKELVFADTLFVNKEYTQLWYKNASGDVKTYELKEIVQMDEKDVKIANLTAQIEEMKGMIENAKYVNTNDVESTSSKKSTSISNDKSSKK